MNDSPSSELAFSDSGQGPPVVILHGLLGSGRNWTTFARQLSASRRVLTLDLRNHGRSPWHPKMDYLAMAQDVIALIENQALGPVRLMGHSMGGKAAMVVALTRSELVERLVVVDIAPVTYDAAYAAPYVAALAEIDPSEYANRRAVDETLAKTVRDQFLRGFLLTNLERSENGLRWCVNLEAITRHMDDLMGFPALTGRYEGPSLFVGGMTSDYLADQNRPAVHGHFPSAKIEMVPEAGHWVHVEAPETFGRIVTEVL
ncbi:MAG: alpha/beta fold hydrolase [Pseudomonadota bacterium]